VVAPNWIGDTLMAQPLLARLRERHPGSRIELLAPPWVAPVARRMAEVDEVIEADLRHGALQIGERWRLGRILRRRGYDHAVVLPNTWKSALVPFFAGIPVRAGYGRPGLLNRVHATTEPRESMTAHYARLAEKPGTDPALPLPPPRLKAGPSQTAARFGISGPYTVLCPGAEYGPAKRWPYFRELSSKLQAQIVVLGAVSDNEAAAGISGRNLVGQTTLDEAIDLIAGAAAVVTNDSGLMHVAAATGTPQVALFGSSSPEHTPALSPVARVLWLKVECSPCFARICPLGHFKCMNELSVERVMRELEALP
jgi:heptosyltransferase-2